MVEHEDPFKYRYPYEVVEGGESPIDDVMGAKLYYLANLLDRQSRLQTAHLTNAARIVASRPLLEAVMRRGHDALLLGRTTGEMGRAGRSWLRRLVQDTDAIRPLDMVDGIAFVYTTLQATRAVLGNVPSPQVTEQYAAAMTTAYSRFVDLIPREQRPLELSMEPLATELFVRGKPAVRLQAIDLVMEHIQGVDMLAHSRTQLESMILNGEFSHRQALSAERAGELRQMSLELLGSMDWETATPVKDIVVPAREVQKLGLQTNLDVVVTSPYAGSWREDQSPRPVADFRFIRPGVTPDFNPSRTQSPTNLNLVVLESYVMSMRLFADGSLSYGSHILPYFSREPDAVFRQLDQGADVESLRALLSGLVVDAVLPATVIEREIEGDRQSRSIGHSHGGEGLAKLLLPRIRYLRTARAGTTAQELQERWDQEEAAEQRASGVRFHGVAHCFPLLRPGQHASAEALRKAREFFDDPAFDLPEGRTFREPTTRGNMELGIVPGYLAKLGNTAITRALFAEQEPEDG